MIVSQSPISAKDLIQNWNITTWSPKPGLKNYVYGRAASTNIQVDIANPVLRAYYSDAGLNPPPQSWVQMFTYNGSNATSPLQTR